MVFNCNLPHLLLTLQNKLEVGKLNKTLTPGSIGLICLHLLMHSISAAVCDQHHRRHRHHAHIFNNRHRAHWEFEHSA